MPTAPSTFDGSVASDPTLMLAGSPSRPWGPPVEHAAIQHAPKASALPTTTRKVVISVIPLGAGRERLSCRLCGAVLPHEARPFRAAANPRGARQSGNRKDPTGIRSPLPGDRCLARRSEAPVKDGAPPVREDGRRQGQLRVPRP